jgi:surfactin synthase thioesterase subunit
MRTLLRQSTIIRIGAMSAARARLLCFPQAGGGAATFRPLATVLPPEVDLCAVRLPGRESRRREAPLTEMEAVVDEVVEALDTMDEVPLVVLGYCSGAFAAYEVARRLLRCRLRAPVKLIALASPAPRVLAPHRWVHTLPPRDLITYLRDARITPGTVLDDPALFALFEPAIRADFQVFETWDHGSSGALELPVTVVGAREDASMGFDDLATWQHHTGRAFTMHVMPGAHDFLGAATAELGWTVLNELLPAR